jgi:hypothetical protein
MINTILKFIFISIITWIVLWFLFWLGALAWLHLSQPEAYAFLTPGPVGTTKSIDNSILDRFYADRRFAIIISAMSSLLIAQTSLLVATLKK